MSLRAIFQPRKECNLSVLTVSREEENLLRLGDEVEFSIEEGKNGRLSGVNVKRLPKGTIKVDEDVPEMQGLTGVVARVSGGKSSGQGRIVICSAQDLKEKRLFVPQVTEETLAEADNKTIFTFSDKDGIGKSGYGSRLSFCRGDIVTFGVVKGNVLIPAVVICSLMKLNTTTAISTGKLRAGKIKLVETGRARAQELTQLKANDATPETGKIHSLSKRSHTKRFLAESDKSVSKYP